MKLLLDNEIYYNTFSTYSLAQSSTACALYNFVYTNVCMHTLYIIYLIYYISVHSNKLKTYCNLLKKK